MYGRCWGIGDAVPLHRLTVPWVSRRHLRRRSRAGQPLSGGLGHRGGQLELDAVWIFKREHVNAERRQAGDLTVPDAVLIKEQYRLLKVIVAGNAEAEMIQSHPVRVEAV